MPRRLLRAVPWLSTVAQMSLAAGVALTVVVGGYVYLNDPLVLESVRGVYVGPTEIRLYFSGYKRHDRCPGHWEVLINGHNGPWVVTPHAVTEKRRTGIAPVGLMDGFPVEVRLPEPLSSGVYGATVIIEYDCILPFRHRASFQIVVP